MSGLFSPAVFFAFPDLLALAVVQKAQGTRPLDVTLDQQGMRAQPLDQQGLLVRGPWSFDFDVIEPERLAYIRGWGPAAAARCADAAWCMGAVVVRFQGQVMQGHGRELEVVWV